MDSANLAKLKNMVVSPASQAFKLADLVTGDAKDAAACDLVQPASGEAISQADAFAGKEVIALYFSASWCPPCRRFTPTLAKVCAELTAAGKGFQAVFIDADKDEASFKEYHAKMTFPAVPHASKAAKAALGTAMDIEGYPTVVLVDAKTGKTISDDGTELISEHGAAGFPYSKERIAELEREVTARRAIKYQELKEALSTMEVPHGKGDTPVKVADALSADVVAFLFGNKDCEPTTQYVAPKLVDSYATVRAEKGGASLEVVYVPLVDGVGVDGANLWGEEEGADDFHKTMPWAVLPRNGGSRKVLDLLCECFGVTSDSTPHLATVITTADKKIQVSDCSARRMFNTGAAGFPWTAERLEALQEEKKQKSEALKASMANFAAFEGVDAGLVDGSGAVVAVEELRKKDVVGLYFSAHWCGPCRAFTPVLVEEYNKLKTAGKSFEVVFVSSDQDQDSFDSYYADMPWLALPYPQRAFKEALSEAYGVNGIPSLILLNGSGEVTTTNGRGALTGGLDYFPWGPEDMKRMAAEKEEREKKKAAAALEAEKESIAEQRKGGGLVLKRVKGAPGGTKVSAADHTVSFCDFDTVACETSISSGKVYYEVELEKLDSIGQFGWVDSGFEHSEGYDGEGVGDDKSGWGIDGVRQVLFPDGDKEWGAEWSKGDVVGFAADLDGGNLSFSLNGKWEAPMGVAFEGIERNGGLFPALTAQDGVVVKVNFGARPFKFAPPDDEYRSVSAAAADA